MNTGRLILTLLLSTSLGVILIGCKDSNDNTGAAASAPRASSAPAAAHKKVALVMKTLTNPFFIEMERGARRAEREFGIELEVKTGSDETAVEQQIQIVDDLIQAHVDAIVIAPGDSQRVISILKKAQSAGIVIINIDNQIDQSVAASQQLKPVPFVSADNDKGGYQIGKYLANRIKKPAQAAIFEGIRSAANAQMRMTGARRAFSENPNIHLVASESANWKIDEAHDLAKKIFAEHPQVSVVFCANDMMALGVMKYLQDSGHKNVMVAGYDALEEAKQAVKAGAMTATVDQQADEQGYQGVAMAVRVLKGESVPATVMVETRIVDAASLSQPTNQ